MSVDLGAGTMGIVELSDGRKWACLAVTPEPDGTYSVRIESGWYNSYRRDGSCADPKGGTRASIVSFKPCTLHELIASKLPTEVTP